MALVRLIGGLPTLHSSQAGLSAVPRVFPSLPPLDSLVCVGELVEEPGQHMTLRFRVKPTHHDAKIHTNGTHMEIPFNVTKQSNFVAKNGLFKYAEQTANARIKLKMEEQLFTDVLRHPPLCS